MTNPQVKPLQTSSSIHALVPAGGSGSRMGFDVPKQFQVLAGIPMICHSLNTLLSLDRIESVWVGVAKEQEHHKAMVWPDSRKLHVCPSAGPTRHLTVLHTLEWMMREGVQASDWVLVHDAARPGISTKILHHLVDSVTAEPDSVGGIVAMPLADTLKSAFTQSLPKIDKTLSRDGLWLAQTPQMFRVAPLRDALAQALEGGDTVTDEASAMEMAGYSPLLVQGEWENLKVTYAHDWLLMEKLLGGK